MDVLKLIVEDYTLPLLSSMSKAIEYHGTDQFIFRAVVKTKGGMHIVDFRDFENKAFSKDPSQLLAYFKKGALQSIEAKSIADDGPTWLTIFRRQGKKVTLIDKQLLYNLTVGTINQFWHNTNLYNWEQYKATNTSSWASYAYRMNEIKQTSTVKA